MIYLHFQRKKSLLSLIIRILTASKFSHVEIEIEGICYSAKAFKGVYKRPTRELFEEAGTIETWAVKNIKKRRVYFLEFLEAQVGKHYDYLPVFALGFLRQNWQENEDKWFCSELIDSALKKAHAGLTNRDYAPHRLTPSQLIPSPKLRYVRTFFKAKGKWYRKLLF